MPKVSPREFQKLKHLDQQALFAWEVPQDVVAAIEEMEVPSGYEHLDVELENDLAAPSKP